MSTGTVTTNVNQSSGPKGTSTTTGITLGIRTPTDFGAAGGSFGQTTTTGSGGVIRGSDAGIWVSSNPTAGVTITGNLGSGTKDFPGGSSSTSSLGVTGTFGGTSLTVSGSQTGMSTGASSQTFSGALSQAVPLGDTFGIRGNLGTSHTTGTQGVFDTKTMGIAGTANIGGGTASLGFDKSNTSGTGGFSQSTDGIKLSFDKQIGGGATLGGFVTSGSVSVGGGPSRPTSGGGISLSCKFGNYNRYKP